jgi:dTMP kinase
MSKGKLIVIDGGDGSGKATQAELLIQYLQKKGIKTKYMDFPRYETFYGQVVGRFLRGEFGDINSVSPYLASLAYAADRATAREEMNEFLNQGGIIISNRYATSNMAHQGAKFKDPTEKKAYMDWDYELEYEINKLPKEDLVIYLHVPWKIGAELTEKKAARSYLKGAALDIHEKDLNHRALVEKTYLDLANSSSHWKTIECVKEGTLLTIESIHQQIVELVEKII